MPPANLVGGFLSILVGTSLLRVRIVRKKILIGGRGATVAIQESK
jgi:hypothetical protein